MLEALRDNCPDNIGTDITFVEWIVGIVLNLGAITVVSLLCFFGHAYFLHPMLYCSPIISGFIGIMASFVVTAALFIYYVYIVTMFRK